MKIFLFGYEIRIINHKKEVKRLLLENRYISAVKYVRDNIVWELKEARNYVDKIRDKMEVRS